MDAKVCNQCDVRLDDGGEYFTIQVYHMECTGIIQENEQVRDLCLKCEAKLRPALDVIDGKQK